MRVFALSILLAALTVWPAALRADAPRTIRQVPSYPGSRVDPALQERERQTFEEGLTGNEGLRSKAIQVMTVAAEPGAVIRWYIDRLGAREEDGAGFDPAILMKGGTSPVQYSVGYYEKDDLENQYEQDLLIRDGAWITSSLKKRQRTADGRIPRYGRFIWEFINPAGGRSELTLTVDDASFDLERKAYSLKTSITVLFQEFDAE